jgi:hypothetical protein
MASLSLTELLTGPVSSQVDVLAWEGYLLEQRGALFFLDNVLLVQFDQAKQCLWLLANVVEEWWAACQSGPSSFMLGAVFI